MNKWVHTIVEYYSKNTQDCKKTGGKLWGSLDAVTVILFWSMFLLESLFWSISSSLGFLVLEKSKPSIVQQCISSFLSACEVGDPYWFTHKKKLLAFAFGTLWVETGFWNSLASYLRKHFPKAESFPKNRTEGEEDEWAETRARTLTAGPTDNIYRFSKYCAIIKLQTAFMWHCTNKHLETFAGGRGASIINI